MKEVIMAFIAGFILGGVFKLLKLPLPAPPFLAGVMGIFGIYFGGIIFEWSKNFWG